MQQSDSLVAGPSYRLEIGHIFVLLLKKVVFSAERSPRTTAGPVRSCQMPWRCSYAPFVMVTDSESAPYCLFSFTLMALLTSLDVFRCFAHTLWIGNSFTLVTSLGLMAHHLFGCWHGDRRLSSKYGEVRSLAILSWKIPLLMTETWSVHEIQSCAELTEWYTSPPVGFWSSQSSHKHHAISGHLGGASAASCWVLQRIPTSSLCSSYHFYTGGLPGPPCYAGR
jgi:hypothetical protein